MQTCFLFFFLGPLILLSQGCRTNQSNKTLSREDLSPRDIAMFEFDKLYKGLLAKARSSDSEDYPKSKRILLEIFECSNQFELERVLQKNFGQQIDYITRKSISEYMVRENNDLPENVASLTGVVSEQIPHDFVNFIENETKKFKSLKRYDAFIISLRYEIKVTAPLLTLKNNLLVGSLTESEVEVCKNALLFHKRLDPLLCKYDDVAGDPFDLSEDNVALTRKARRGMIEAFLYGLKKINENGHNNSLIHKGI
jgi:hypothetical protein